MQLFRLHTNRKILNNTLQFPAPVIQYFLQLLTNVSFSKQSCHAAVIQFRNLGLLSALHNLPHEHFFDVYTHEFRNRWLSLLSWGVFLVFFFVLVVVTFLLFTLLIFPNSDHAPKKCIPLGIPTEEEPLLRKRLSVDALFTEFVM